ncbi:hypothetical protein KAR91_59270 [Candidatus Pacearchaeota archaeon]|nr:hypothetical protein [Candidatus Pacearchaeota archaeon]
MLKKSRFDRLIILASPDISRGVYESHVISLIENIKNNYDLKFGIISFGKTHLSLDETTVLNNRIDKLKNLAGEKNILFLEGRSILKMNKLTKNVQKFIDNYKDENLIIFCQNYYMGFIGCLIKRHMTNIHVHIDFKGVVPEEHLMYGESNIFINVMSYVGAKIFERNIFKYGDSFSAVSYNFKKYFENKYRIGSRPFIVLPSSVDTDKFFFENARRKTYRKKLGYEDSDIVIIYSGSLKKWQQPEVIFKFFLEASKQVSYKFLILTFDTDKANRLLYKYTIPKENITILAVSPLDVTNYLNASDICLLIRKDDIVNNVASPTKFGEYLVTKNKIIISKGVGDFSTLIAKSNYGVCIYNEHFEPRNILRVIETKKTPTDSEILGFKYEYSAAKNIEKLNEILE